MHLARVLPILFFPALTWMGCKSDAPIVFSPIPKPAVAPVAAQDPAVSTTNVYYMVATGPGHAFFFLESANTFFGGSPEANVVGGTRVVVINGHYPMPEEMPGQTILPTAQILSRNDYRRRDLSLIDTSWVLPNDLK